MSKKKYDFSGYATKVGLKCSDGRTILPDAFQECDGKIVPLVFQHIHNDPKNILGHALLENRKDGVYSYCSLNDTEAGKIAKALVAHGDITALSIYANGLVEKGKNVMHGTIREVSLVIAGSNPEAYIDNLAFEHADGSITTDETEAIICAGAFSEDKLDISEDLTLSHEDKKEKKDSEETVGDVFDTLTDDQKAVVYSLIAVALEETSEDDKKKKEDSKKEDKNENTAEHSNIGGETDMKKNIFDKGTTSTTGAKTKLTREELRTIFTEAKQSQSTLANAFLAHGYESIGDAFAAYEHRDNVLAHAGTYGIDNIGYLFPEAKTLTNTPAFLKRDTEWVSKVFGAAKHVPFSRIKSVVADITADEARARGYVTGKKKLDEVITLLKRTTDPQTVYKRQRLDRDDVIDITDFDVVMWLRSEMRMMLEEEIARALLVGDGRPSSSDDKIKEDKIRPIATDDSLYTVEIQIPVGATTSYIIDQIVLGRKQYKGTGNPTFFTTSDLNGDMLLLKDKNDRRIYNNEADLAAGIRAREIVEVPVMDNKVIVITPATSTEAGLQKRLIGISVNMSDYALGADKGGSITAFDDFDIDYNQYKYLIETRCSGALTLPHSAIAYWKLETIPKTGE
ncbi:MAG: phage major capsid protein [Crenarchaeota archaeon]|nr:phage major capsid protein [Thermoproteota archaeon]